MSYTELTVWTRGIIMDKEGRDIVNSISASARLEGKFAQAMENYVDNPDRTNAPTRKYCRVSDAVLENELTYENEQPNIVVLVEETMVKGWDYMRGMPPGGTLVINTQSSNSKESCRNTPMTPKCWPLFRKSRQKPLSFPLPVNPLGRRRCVRTPSRHHLPRRWSPGRRRPPLLLQRNRRPKTVTRRWSMCSSPRK